MWWLQGRRKLSRTGNYYVYGRDKVDSRSRIHFLHVVHLSWLQGFHQCHKVPS